jgi:hypothetical protein
MLDSSLHLLILLVQNGIMTRDVSSSPRSSASGKEFLKVSEEARIKSIRSFIAKVVA